MNNNYKNIHIGELIRIRVLELKIDNVRICKFLKCSEKEIVEMMNCSSLDSHLLLKWSKLLQYDFFRLYSQHLIFYSPLPSKSYNFFKDQDTALPKFRKSIYSKDIVDFILEMFLTGAKSKSEIMTEYRIPKTTLYKWIKKYAPEKPL